VRAKPMAMPLSMRKGSDEPSPGTTSRYSPGFAKVVKVRLEHLLVGRRPRPVADVPPGP